MSEIDTFFDGLPKQDEKVADVFADPEKKPVVPEKGEEGKNDGDEAEGRKNRRHRRLEDKLKAKDEMLIALNERVKVLSETQQFQRDHANDSNTEMPAEWVALYGDTPEAKRAWGVQEKLLAKYSENAKTEALQEFEERQQKAIDEQKSYEALIDSELESIEETFNVDLTSDAPAARKARREFLEEVQKMSPKDENGTVLAYADFDSVWESYDQKRKAAIPADNVSRQKELASRSMQKSGSSNAEGLREITPGFHGWKQDYNLNG